MSILDFFRKKQPNAVEQPSEISAVEQSPRSNGEKWPFGLPVMQSTHVSLDHAATRHQARIAMQDSLHARAIVERFADTVVDTGLRLVPSPMAEFLGMTPEQASEWSRDIAARFHAFASKKTVMLNRSMTLYQAQRMAEVFQQRDNDYFVRFHYSNPTGGRTSTVQIQFIDPDQVCGEGYISEGKKIDNVIDGIQYDDSGVETGFMVETWNQKKRLFEMKYVPAFIGDRVQMIHCFQSEYAGQKRGLSRLAHAIQEFSNLTDFGAAHIQKAINQSAITMTVESDTEMPATNPFSDLAARRGAGPGAPVELVAPTSLPGNRETTLQEDMGFMVMPEVAFQRPGSVGVFNLKGRQRLKPFSGTAPSEHYDAFVSSFMSHLSASLSVPLEIVLMKFNQNYSASRASLLLFWRVARIWQAEKASDFLDPLYETWLSEEIAAGRVSAPGFSDPWLRQAWLCTTWRGQPMPNIDPMKTAKADKEYIEMGAQTFSDVSANLNGSDFYSNVAENRAAAGSLPQMPWTKVATAPSASAPASNTPQERDEDQEDDESEDDNG